MDKKKPASPVPPQTRDSTAPQSKPLAKVPPPAVQAKGPVDTPSKPASQSPQPLSPQSQAPPLPLPGLSELNVKVDPITTDFAAFSSEVKIEQVWINPLATLSEEDRKIVAGGSVGQLLLASKPVDSSIAVLAPALPATDEPSMFYLIEVPDGREPILHAFARLEHMVTKLREFFETETHIFMIQGQRIYLSADTPRKIKLPTGLVMNVEEEQHDPWISGTYLSRTPLEELALGMENHTSEEPVSRYGVAAPKRAAAK